MYVNWGKQQVEDTHVAPCQNTVFLQSDATATIYFAARFVRLLFEGCYYSRVATIRGRRLFFWRAWRPQLRLDKEGT